MTGRQPFPRAAQQRRRLSCAGCGSPSDGDQSDAERAGIFSRRTNRTQEACVYSHQPGQGGRAALVHAPCV
eukprot:7603720-Pyramimonas_sp.AAC.1